MGQIDPAHIAVAEHPEGLTRDTVADKVVSNTLAFRNDMRGAGAGKAVGKYQYLLCQPCGRGEDKAGERVHPDGHPAHPCRKHREEPGLGGHGMNHRRLLPSEDPDKPPQRLQIFDRRYAALHRNGDNPYGLALRYLPQLLAWRADSHDIIALLFAKLAEQAAAERIQRPGDGGCTDYFQSRTIILW